MTNAIAWLALVSVAGCAPEAGTGGTMRPTSDAGPAPVSDAGTPIDAGPGRDEDAGRVREDAGDPAAPPPSGPPPGADGDHASFVPMASPVAARWLVVLGDSISAGAGASRPALSYGRLLHGNEPSRWPGASDLEDRFGDLELVDGSRGGATTEDVLREQLLAVSARLPDPAPGHVIVVMTVGGNDLMAAARDGSIFARREETLDAIADRLDRAVGHMRDSERFPDGVSVYVAAVYDPSDGTGGAGECGLALPDAPEVIAALNERYVARARARGFAVVDASGHFLGHGHTVGPLRGWFADCVHPNDRGHHELRRLFLEAIEGRDDVE